MLGGQHPLRLLGRPLSLNGTDTPGLAAARASHSVGGCLANGSYLCIGSGRRLLDWSHAASRQWGLAAVLFALLTVEFFSASREITLDQYTSLAAALGFYLVYSADCLGSRKRLWLLLPT